MAEQSDAALMLRMREDDSKAFGELYDRYVALAFRVANSVCPDAGRAEDAVREGFLSIWRGRAQYQPGSGSVKGWALALVRRQAMDAERREASERNVPVARSEADALRAVMARLPDIQAEVITLAFFGGLTDSEIAEQLSLPAGTVKGRMRLGMHKLRAAMNEQEAAGAPDAAAPHGRAPGIGSARGGRVALRAWSESSPRSR